MSKIFLGGTCNNSDWRDRLIPILENNDINYFNPIVEDWTSECIEIEENEKDNVCDIHLFLITSEMTGVYSVAEMMASATQSDKKTIFVVISDGFTKSQIKSLMATAKLAKKYSNGIFLSHFMNREEKFEVIKEMILFERKR